MKYKIRIFCFNNSVKEELCWKKCCCIHLYSTDTFNSLWFFFSVGLLGGDSWPPAFEFLDFLKLMDMEEEDEEIVDEEDFLSFSSAEIYDDDSSSHTEL